MEEIPKVAGNSSIKFWKKKKTDVSSERSDVSSERWTTWSAAFDAVVQFVVGLTRWSVIYHHCLRTETNWFQVLKKGFPDGHWGSTCQKIFAYDMDQWTAHLMLSMERSKCLIKRIQKNRDLIAIGPFDWWEIQMFDQKKPEEQRSVLAIRPFDWLWYHTRLKGVLRKLSWFILSHKALYFYYRGCQCTAPITILIMVIIKVSQLCWGCLHEFRFSIPIYPEPNLRISSQLQSK